MRSEYSCLKGDSKGAINRTLTELVVIPNILTTNPATR